MNLDLEPSEWRSEREKPREPFFGKGLGPGLAWLLGFSLMVTIVHVVRAYLR